MSSLDHRLREGRLPVATPRYIVGQDPQGRWIVRSPDGLGGGYFVSRAAAIRYAAFEGGIRPAAVALAGGPVELSF